MTAKEVYDRDVAEGGFGSDDEKRRVAELSALVKMGLGHKLEHCVLVALAGIQADLHRTQMALVAKLDSGTLSPEAYLDQLSETQYSAQARCISILGHETFAAIFGETVRSPEGFIDREAFLSQRPPTITGLAH